MTKVMITLLFVYLLALANGGPLLDQTSATKLKYPVAVKVTSPRYEYRTVVRSIRDVDFKNLQYHLLGTRFRLRNGSLHTDQRVEETDGTDHFDVDLDRIWYFDFEGPQPRRALVSIRLLDIAATSTDTGFVLLFEIVNGHPVVTQQFEYDGQVEGAGAAFNVETGVLTIKARAYDGSAHCCPENLETDEFKWQGQAFKLIRRDILSLPKSQIWRPQHQSVGQRRGIVPQEMDGPDQHQNSFLPPSRDLESW